MARPKILDATSRTLMAKAYNAGTPPSELARHYGVSASYVINTARQWQVEQSLRRLKTLEKEARRQIVPPPITMPEPKVRFSRSGEWISETATGIPIPYVSIQHGNREQDAK